MTGLGLKNILLLWAIKAGGKPAWEAKGKQGTSSSAGNVMGMIKKFFGV